MHFRLAVLPLMLWRAAASSPVFPPVEGVVRCVWSSAGQTYVYQGFYTRFSFKEATFGWVAPLNCTFQSENTLVDTLSDNASKACEEAYGKTNFGVHVYDALTKWPDLNYKYQRILPANLEVGFGVHLVPEDIDIITKPDGSWTVRNMLGSRVSSSLHTNCCFEISSSIGKTGGFIHTEFCIQKPFNAFKSKSDTAFWYANRSYAEMNDETRHNCLTLQGNVEFSKSWFRANMPDNHTAVEFWTKLAEKEIKGVGRPWTEVYTGYADRAATILYA